MAERTQRTAAVGENTFNETEHEQIRTNIFIDTTKRVPQIQQHDEMDFRDKNSMHGRHCVRTNFGLRLYVQNDVKHIKH